MKGTPLIIGAGIAGLSVAIRMSPQPVTVLTGAPLGEGAATAWAQGGIAAALGADDSPQNHAQDTVVAGAGCVDADVALRVARQAPAQIEWLEKCGLSFDRDAHGHVLLGREAAHSHNRIVHAGGDSTGAAVMQTLIAKAKATPSITLRSGWRALDLHVVDNQVRGVFIANGTTQEFFPTPKVVLATGGVGQLYAYTTNPPSATGEGLAMAARAGAVLGDLEFVQFHPTALAVTRDPLPLLTEALRGDGATLVNERGERFMLAEHDAAELAPRDVVARAISKQLLHGHRPMLDARTVYSEAFAKKYPFIMQTCREEGLDPARQPLPIVPAAHYHMGGVRVDNNGRSNLSGLWVCGEVACTGLHGANRLASNSLLEALVYAEQIALDIGSDSPSVPSGSAPPAPSPRPELDAYGKALLRQTMFEKCGLTRTANDLRDVLELVHKPLAQLSSMEMVAGMIAYQALQRCESRGSHMRSDFPFKVEPVKRQGLKLSTYIKDMTEIMNGLSRKVGAGA